MQLKYSQSTVSEWLRSKFNKPELTLNTVVLDQSLVNELLRDDTERLKHVFGVLKHAEEMFKALLTAQEWSALRIAALFHDIGYSAKIKHTGFHPLDGAIFLAHSGAPESSVLATLYHTGAIGEVAVCDVARDIYSQLGEMPSCRILDCLTLADLKTGPDGSSMTLSERVNDVYVRYGAGHPVAENIQSQLPLFYSIIDRLWYHYSTTKGLPIWVAADVDNTLVTPSENLSETNFKSIVKFRKEQGKLTLATGKHPKALLPLIHALGLEEPQIAGCGAAIIKPDSQPLCVQPCGSLLGDRAFVIHDILEKEMVPHVIFSLDEIYNFGREITAFHRKILADISEPDPIRNIPVYPERIFKVLTFCTPDNVELEVFLRGLAVEHELGCIRSGYHFIEFMDSTTSKANAFQKILNKHQWPRFLTAMIGDSENDIPLLRIAGRSFAVGNADNLIRHCADTVVSTCVENGFSDMIRILKQTTP